MYFDFGSAHELGKLTNEQGSRRLAERDILQNITAAYVYIEPNNLLMI